MPEKEEKAKHDNISDNNEHAKAKIVGRILVISILFLLLIISYVSMFSTGASGGSFFGTKLVGVINSENFYNAKTGDLISVQKVTNIQNITINEVVVFQLNGEVGSVKVSRVDYDNKVIYSKSSMGTERGLAYELVIGEQQTQIPVLGFIWGFFASPLGALIISLVLLAYVYYITFSRINREETEKGKQLLEQLKNEKHEALLRKKILSEFRKTDGFSVEDSNIIDGSMGDNLIELVSYTSQGTQKTITDTYYYILEKVHRTYMTKQRLTKRERTRVSNVIEMCPIVEHFDDSIAYRLIDLILHEPIIDFDISGFEKLCLKFLSKDITEDDLLNFGNVLYVLFEKNKKMKLSSTSKIVSAYYNKVMRTKIAKESELRIIANNLMASYCPKDEYSKGWQLN